MIALGSSEKYIITKAIPLHSNWIFTQKINRTTHKTECLFAPNVNFVPLGKKALLKLIKLIKL